MQRKSNIKSTLIAIKNNKIINYVPLFIGLIYLLFTLLLFFLAPFYWPINDWSEFYIYIVATLFALIFGYILGQHASIYTAREFRHSYWIIFGGILAVILLFPTSYIYSGRWPWDVFDALVDQNDTYKRLAEQLKGDAVSRLPIVLARSMTQPVIFSVIPLGSIYWGKLSRNLKMLVIATIMSSAIFSILRGTTRELADMAAVIISAITVATCRAVVHGRLAPAQLVRQLYRVSVGGAGLVAIVLISLTIRTSSRLGEAVTSFCIGDSGICASSSLGLEKYVPNGLIYTYETMTAYFAQGYCGIALAMKRDFNSSWGVGHSPALLSLAKLFFDAQPLYDRSYTYRNFIDNWSDETQWSGLSTWLANDISFPGTLFFFVGLAYLWALSWRDAVYRSDDRATIFFCIIMVMIFYFPVNNQMMATLDNYTTLLFWLFFWSLNRNKKST